MTRAFVLENETILCRQTPNGWLPTQVTLPPTATSTTDDNGTNQPQSYQLGRVQLQASLASTPFIHSQPSDSMADNSMAVNQEAPATSAISYYYAQNNRLALPTVSLDTDLSTDLVKNNKADSSKISPEVEDTYAFITYRELLSQLSVALADQLSQAIQLLRWQADTQFCSRCSAPVNAAKSGERAMVCSVCRLRQYPRVQPCVITAITRPNPQTGETQILLAHHHRYGQKSPSLQYGLIAGFVEVGESLEHAVMREVAEEVGITLTDIRYVSSQPWPFPSNLMLGFRATYNSGDIILQEDELSHADFFDLSNLPKIPFKGSIAYDLIAQIAHEQGVCL